MTEERSADVIIQIAKPVLEQKKLYLITKRAFDIVCSFLGLLILAIPMIIIALSGSGTIISALFSNLKNIINGKNSKNMRGFIRICLYAPDLTAGPTSRE